MTTLKSDAKNYSEEGSSCFYFVALPGLQPHRIKPAWCLFRRKGTLGTLVLAFLLIFSKSFNPERLTDVLVNSLSKRYHSIGYGVTTSEPHRCHFSFIVL